MSDIKLFRYGNEGVQELEGKAAQLEKHLQALVEANMSEVLGVRILASEYVTGNLHKGRIDSLGLDENGCPVIVEYKRHTNENVINQGLFYLDWLLDHRGEFELLVLKNLGQEAADNIEWGSTRLLCIAADYTRYDQHAVQQINRNIELIRYRLFGDDLLLLDLVNVVSSDSAAKQAMTSPDANKAKASWAAHADRMANASPELVELFQSMQEYALSLGDEVQSKTLKEYVAFRRLKNFVCATVLPKQDPHVKLWLRLNPDSVQLEGEFIKDVRGVGHWGTGDLQIVLRTLADLEQVKPLIQRSYEEN